MRQDGRCFFFTSHGISFPVSDTASFLHDFRPVINPALLCFFPRSTALFGTMAPAKLPLLLPQIHPPLRSFFEDILVDGFMAYIFRVFFFSSTSGDLLRRPILFQSRNHIGTQFGILSYLSGFGFSAFSSSQGNVMSFSRIIEPRSSIPCKFTTDTRRVSFEKLRDLFLLVARLKPGFYLKTFSFAKVSVGHSLRV